MSGKEGGYNSTETERGEKKADVQNERPGRTVLEKGEALYSSRERCKDDLKENPTTVLEREARLMTSKRGPVRTVLEKETRFLTSKRGPVALDRDARLMTRKRGHVQFQRQKQG